MKACHWRSTSSSNASGIGAAGSRAIAGATLALLAAMATPSHAGGRETLVWGPAASPETSTQSFQGSRSNNFSRSQSIGGSAWSVEMWTLGSSRRTAASAEVTGNVAAVAEARLENALQAYTLTPPASGADFAGGRLVIYAKLAPGDISGNATIDLRLDVRARRNANWEATGTGQRAVDGGAGSEEVEFPVVVDLPATLDSTVTVTVESTMVLVASARIAPSGGAHQSASADAYYGGGEISGFAVLNAAGAQVTGFTLTGGQLSVQERASPPAGLARAVEFFHRDFDHYFVTTNPVEIANLDTGRTPGWQRTGQSFAVYAAGDTGRSPVCRFFSEAFAPKSSHFYAPRGFGCEAVLANPGWQYEGDVFFTPIPAADGSCPAGTVAVFRLYNDGMGGAPNHRFTTSEETFAAMHRDGWIAEGAGVGVGMCSPL